MAISVEITTKREQSTQLRPYDNITRFFDFGKRQIYGNQRIGRIKCE